jgi:hypothetical protein
MFLYRGWQAVEKGTYWDPDTGKKIVMKDEGLLPANRKETYLKLPESYLLIPLFVVGLALSAALPFGIGVALFASMVVLHKILFHLVCRCEEVFGNGLAHMWVAYRPGFSFFTGKGRRPKPHTNRKTGGNR